MAGQRDDPRGFLNESQCLVRTIRTAARGAGPHRALTSRHVCFSRKALVSDRLVRSPCKDDIVKKREETMD